MVSDASAGTILCSAEPTLIGYAAYGKSIGSAVQPLVDCFSLDLFDDGDVIRSGGSGPPVIIDDHELGSKRGREGRAAR